MALYKNALFDRLIYKKLQPRADINANQIFPSSKCQSSPKAVFQILDIHKIAAQHFMHRHL